jgi:two-component system invasion response regulator UvrY
MVTAHITSPDHALAVGVMIVDDQAIFRAAARDVVRATPGFEPVGEASSGAEAVAMFGALEPDLVLMDVRMPDMGGMETTRRLRDVRPDALVVLITLEDARDMASAAERCGAVTLVRKHELCPRMLARLWATCRGS